VPELIKLAKESATPLNYNSPGAGVAQHLSMEYMKQRFGLNMVHVPYRNTPHWITDIVAGHVQLGFAEAGASLPLIREGQAARAGGVGLDPHPDAAQRAAIR